MKAFNYTCIGESHIKSGKVCQDYSLTINLDGFTAAIVCDGHGSARYFRSDIGAKYAGETTSELIQQFVENFDKHQIIGKKFTQRFAKNNPKNDTEDELYPIFEQLFKSIITTWYQKIEEHAHQNPITAKESELCEPEWIDEFKNGVKIEKSYGCTLMAAVFTPEYWFAFHIGDGKMVALQENPIFTEPVPWDDKCFLNKTTSLCDTEPLNEFRYCYNGDGTSPDAIFLGSDGIDDTFGDGENLAEFYIKIAKNIVENGEEKTSEEVKKLLPDLSKRGSQDDMSLAVVYDADKVSTNMPVYNKFLARKVDTEIVEKRKRVEKFNVEKKSKTVEYERSKQAKEDIEKKVASTKQEYETALKEWKDTEEKVNKLLDLITGKKSKVKELEDTLKALENSLAKSEQDLKYSERALQIAENELSEEDAALQNLLKKKSELAN